MRMRTRTEAICYGDSSAGLYRQSTVVMWQNTDTIYFDTLWISLYYYFFYLTAILPDCDVVYELERRN